MSNRSETFGRLLKGAINSIAAYEGKAAPTIEEELGTQIGVTGASIQRYKAGYLPPEPRSVRILAEIGMRRGFLARAWLVRFLQAARYPTPDILIAQLSDAPAAPAISPRTDLPDGMIALLCTNIADSSNHWEVQPCAMERALERHDAIMRQAISAGGGQVFKAVGDAFYAVFTTALAALEAALSAQQVLQSELWGLTSPLNVRMAIHVGVPQQRDGDYVGPSLNRVVRLLSVGHGGQILLSLSAQELVGDLLPPGVSLRDLGEQRLNDLGRPERIYQATAPNLAADFPPLAILHTYRHNLPPQATQLVGREAEVERVRELLDRGQTRLLTLTGPGGIGKTRLALQVAVEQLDAYRDGVTFVALESVRDPAYVLVAIAQALGLRAVAELPLIEQLKHALKARQTVLVLDNFEQVITAAPLIGELLAAAPEVKALVTSREVLHLYGEQAYEVPPLALPEPWQMIPITHLAQVEAVRLFVERAQAVRPDFTVTPANAPVIAEICRRLDGLPLAIELAAARSKLFPPQALLARLDRRLQILTGGAQNLPPRQQTLVGAIVWSYDLLDATEQTIFARLGIFEGGCSLEMAEAVCGDDRANDAVAAYVPTDAVLNGLATLVDRSLLRQVAGPNDEPRFLMLETIREYALDRLSASGEAAAITLRHARATAALIEQAEPLLRGPEQIAWLDRLDSELSNIRAALTWSLSADPEIALRIVGASWRYWSRHGLVPEGLAWAERALARQRDGSLRSQARALLAAGYLAIDPSTPGKRDKATIWLTESRALWQALGDHTGEGYCLTFLASNIFNDARTADDLESLEELCRESETLARRVGDKWLLAWIYNALGGCRQGQGDRSGEQRYFEQWLQTTREIGDISGICDALRIIASRIDAPYAQCIAWLEESERLAHELGDQWIVAAIHNTWGEVARYFHEYEPATIRYQACLTVIQDQGMRHMEPTVLCNLGRLAELRNDLSTAAACYRQALVVAREYSDQMYIWVGLAGLAQVAAAGGSATHAARIFGAITTFADGRLWLKFSPGAIDEQFYDNGLTTARAALGDLAFDAAFANGQALRLNQAIVEALTQL